MPKPPVTPLAYLMEMLYIQGTQLAEAIHVDRTIISRWKNGRVELNIKSRYFSDIVNAILDINAEQGLKTLERFFSSDGVVKIKGRSELYSCVARWLLTKDFAQKQRKADEEGGPYIASYKIYRGELGKRKAILSFVRTFNSLPAGTKIWGFDEDPSIFEYWLPLFLPPKTEAYFTSDRDAPFWGYLYCIEKRLALVGMTLSEDDGGDLHTAIYDDPATVARFEAFLKKHMKGFQPMTRSSGGRRKGLKKDLVAEFLEQK